MQKISPEINIFAQTDFRNLNRRFGIKIDDRRRHMYIIGKTGMGKSTMLENMIVNDMIAGHGVALIDPHGDMAEKVIDFVPPERMKDVIYFNPADTEHPLGFNILENVTADHRHLVASGLMGVFKKIWPDVWSARMEYILNNTILALLECNYTTLLSINRLLADNKYRKNIMTRVTDPVVKAFWITEFDRYDEKYKREAVAAIQNKIGQFLSASIVRNIVAQRKSTFNVREIMDKKKIFIVNLSKGRIGEDASRLLGGMLITKIQLSAMERVDTTEADRQDFFLYVDEFQNFATESFAGILSEARKYRLSLIMAHQYVKQLDEKVADAVFGNVGTIVTFRVGADDAEILEKEFTPTFLGEDIVNLPKFHVYLKLMIDGMASQPFSAASLSPIAERTGSSAGVIANTRENYAKPRAAVEERIRTWSLGDAPEDYTDAATVSSDHHPSEVLAPIVRPLTIAQPSFNAPAALPPQMPSPQPKKENKLPPPEQWHAATCGRCGAATTVPFYPDGSRKIYCKDCYKFRHEDDGAPSVAVVRPIALQQPQLQPQALSSGDGMMKKKRKRKRKHTSSTGYEGNAPRRES
ncbi:MAG: hypothetical protein A3C15_00275 [Candidatus Magasanikbacteria bacterium RIFCSPHIGHO2_02_FULL_50_9b]|uniref:Uncharacterized protein n=1 Tax=Candidatus Magasanikbacteria bacterium RIFCSPHIGHO2_02_FULL_50_9b TaxID=1798682 RepID=A0A1F6M7C6_9BACT|nr:MAG: hypothetical protein A3C15_00275 [Candidatus Magasanikbacteria bacterium RIFCSPHIGHO2_02_FULL_50_9b]